MRLSRLLIAVAAAFSASAFAMLPPEPRPAQDESMPPQSSMPPSSAEENERREENAWLSTRPNDAWQSSAQRESDKSHSTAQENDVQSPAPTARSLSSDPSDASRQIGRSQEESS